MHRFAFDRRATALIGALLIAAALFAGWQWSSSSQSIAIARAITNGDPSRAPHLVRRYGCGGCHTIPGAAGADGKVGASLQGLRQRVYIAGVTPNNGENLVRWLVNPQQFSPQTAMPPTGITENEARDVAAFLYSR